MRLREIGTVAAALGNQLAAGLPMDQAVSRMPRLQPNYAEFWMGTLREIQSGEPLSASLRAVWPRSIVAAVVAGEHSGRLENVFARIDATLEQQLRLRASLMRLAYPGAMALAGLAVFVGFMVFVLPPLAKSLGRKGPQGAVFQLSSWLSEVVHEHWFLLACALAAGVWAAASWLRTEAGREALLEWGLQIPVLREALRDIFFGVWAHYMATMVSAGIPTIEAARLTARILPHDLRQSVLAFERDLAVNNKTLADAADQAKLPSDDPRAVWWPFYISNALVVAEHTQEIDRELLRVAPSLLKEGERTLDRSIALANVVALALAAAMIVAPLAAYYIEIFAAIRHAAQ